MEFPVKADISDSVNETIMNLSGPTTKNVGQTLGDLVFLCLGGISHEADKRRLRYAHSLDLFQRNLTEKVNSIPQEKLVEPDTQKILSALDDAKFCVDHDELRTLFENLIASTLSADTAEFVHPAFSQIIRRFSVQDAKVIALFATEHAYPLVEYRTIFEDNTFSIKQSNTFLPTIGAATFKEKEASLLCLASNGLIKISYESYISKEDAYADFFVTEIFHELNNLLQKLKETAEFLEVLKNIPAMNNLPEIDKLDAISKKIKKIDVKKGRCDLTELGFNFLRSCGYSL